MPAHREKRSLCAEAAGRSDRTPRTRLSKITDVFHDGYSGGMIGSTEEDHVITLASRRASA